MLKKTYSPLPKFSSAAFIIRRLTDSGSVHSTTTVNQGKLITILIKSLTQSPQTCTVLVNFFCATQIGQFITHSSLSRHAYLAFPLALRHLIWLTNIKMGGLYLYKRYTFGTNNKYRGN